jgi:GAF domain-containing protein
VTSPSGRSPLLDALIGAAVAATGSDRGWLLATADSELVVVAASGGNAATRLGARSARGPGAGGWAGSVVDSGRPVALAPESDDPRFRGDLVVGIGTRPATLLCFPCAYGGRVLGALQLVDKAARAPYSLDDVELVTLLAEVAGAALDELGGLLDAGPPEPDELGAALRFLAAANPGRYATMAGLVGELLAHG